LVFAGHFVWAGFGRELRPLGGAGKNDADTFLKIGFVHNLKCVCLFTLDKRTTELSTKQTTGLKNYPQRKTPPYHGRGRFGASEFKKQTNKRQPLRS
jgi:hypothetical protein